MIPSRYQQYLSGRQPYARATSRSSIEKYGDTIDCFATIVLPAFTTYWRESAMRDVKVRMGRIWSSPIVTPFDDRVGVSTEI